MPKMLQQWLKKIEQLDPNKIELGLDRIKKVAQKLGLLPFSIPAIVVSGTNGKGSCVALLEKIYQAAGYRVGSYISPHLIHFNERIRIETQAVDDQSLCDAFAQIEQVRETIDLTYFEFTTLAALLILAKKQLDIVILEVGLGGRLDAVNIVDGMLSMITSIGLDHCEWLGNTREAITIEKAGIARSHRPLVCGDLDPPTVLLELAAQRQVPFYGLGREFSYTMEDETTWHWQSQSKIYRNLPMPQILLANAASVLQAVVLLADQFPVDEAHIRKALIQAAMPGRLQALQIHQINYLIDVAHNAHAVGPLKAYLKAHPISGKNIAVFGMLKDKDIQACLALLEDEIQDWCIAPLTSARSFSLEEMQQLMAPYKSFKVYPANDILSALAQAESFAQAHDRLIAFGSFFVAGAVLHHLKQGHSS